MIGADKFSSLSIFVTSKTSLTSSPAEYGAFIKIAFFEFK